MVTFWIYAGESGTTLSGIIRKLMTDPHCMAKLDTKGMVGTISAGDHKALLYT